MATFRTFEEIEAWKLARELTSVVYDITRRSQVERDFAFCNQIRRACISISANIAEGFERNGNREFLQFLSLAKASAGEVRSLLYVALDQRYISEVEFDCLKAQCLSVSGKTQNLMDYLRKSEFQGAKYSADQPQRGSREP